LQEQFEDGAEAQVSQVMKKEDPRRETDKENVIAPSKLDLAARSKSPGTDSKRQQDSSRSEPSVEPRSYHGEQTGGADSSEQGRSTSRIARFSRRHQSKHES